MPLPEVQNMLSRGLSRRQRATTCFQKRDVSVLNAYRWCEGSIAFLKHTPKASVKEKEKVASAIPPLWTYLPQRKQVFKADIATFSGTLPCDVIQHRILRCSILSLVASDIHEQTPPLSKSLWGLNSNPGNCMRTLRNMRRREASLRAILDLFGNTRCWRHACGASFPCNFSSRTNQQKYAPLQKKPANIYHNDSPPNFSG